ncbi:mRNA metabolism modulator [Enterobacter phage vB_EclM_Q7622]|uniref:mRNA metabolism modulator n=1 Tax=Enterobacter phage vB_EclM_Q7622 TaxID=2908628 RepID=UPI0023295E5F|nr:mRNA metabolism modulator [Enterobacter phage vB_EclM_Q7622]UIS65528.1 mRNA metabolism modulator [Enterobacter phage vB_EclM_Q7622]
MHKFTEGYYYYFKSMHDHALFTQRCIDNRVFANFVGTHPFKVVEVDDYGNAQRVVNHAGETDFVHLDAVNEGTYFKVAFDKAWCVNAGYQLKDATSLKKVSSINITFLREIGYNPFIVESVCLGPSYDLKTMRLKYVDPDDRSKFCYLNFTLTEDEIGYFEEWKRPIVSGFIRGETIADVMPILSKYPKTEYDDIEKDLGIVDEPNTSWVDEQMAEAHKEIKPFKVETKGKIRFVVEDEFTRLKAIEMLTNMVFK